MLFLILILSSLSLTATEQNSDVRYCDKDTKICSSTASKNFDGKKLLFYDVNPSEGFNLRRDVYMRFAIMLAEARKQGKKTNWTLVLPPWHRLYHWKSQKFQPEPWSTFFGLESLKSYAPVAELHEVFTETSSKTLEIDTLYVLQNYPDAFADGTFVDKWETMEGDCVYNDYFWGYNNVTVKEIICVRYQGKISMLLELLSVHPSDKRVMIAHGEIPIHDTYGSKSYWDCRKSMKFNKELVKTAREFIRKHLDCNIEKCRTYVSIHWRRQDFARGRKNEVPSVSGTAKQIDKFIKKRTSNIIKIFIASDASETEIEQLENQLKNLGYEVYNYLPSVLELNNFKDGGVAIIDQIICSHAAYFIGTHESTFSYRIQEEREILRFDSSTTFNRLCPDTGKCELPSKWTIVD